MRTILFILQKEFKQIFRNRAMLPIIFLMPIFQLLVLSNVATYEIKNLKLAVVDRDMSSDSRFLISKMTSSNYFQLVSAEQSIASAELLLQENKADLYIEIPKDFSKDLTRENQAKLMLTVNAIDGSKAGLANFYANAIIKDYNIEIRQKYFNSSSIQIPKLINIEYSNWFNPNLNYKSYMVPGILVILVTMIAGFLSSMNIVVEKEIGTIEQLNVTPIKKYQFIIGKLLPFWILGLFIMMFGFAIAKVVFAIPVVGNPAIIFLFANVYIFAILGLGLFISTVTETQQQAMFLTWFLMVVFLLLGGLFTAIENMPVWTQNLTRFNPVRYFIEVIRMVLLKGSTFSDIQMHFYIITFFAIAINTLAIWKYKKTS